MTDVKYSSNAWVFWKREVDLLDIFRKNFLQIVLGARLNDHILNSKLYKNVVQSSFLVV